MVVCYCRRIKQLREEVSSGVGGQLRGVWGGFVRVRGMTQFSWLRTIFWNTFLGWIGDLGRQLLTI